MRSKYEFLAAALILALAAPAAGQGLRPHVELPDEPVRGAIFANCSACHGIDVYAYNALDRAGWQALLENEHKRKRGLEIAPRHEEILLDYLVENFGPDTVPFPREYVAPRIDSFFSDADARVFLEQTCTVCHELRVFGRRHDTAEWRELVLEMRGNGADLSDEDLERLVEWLGRVRGPEDAN